MAVILTMVAMKAVVVMVVQFWWCLLGKIELNKKQEKQKRRHVSQRRTKVYSLHPPPQGD